MPGQVAHAYLVILKYILKKISCIANQHGCEIHLISFDVSITRFIIVHYYVTLCSLLPNVARKAIAFSSLVSWFSPVTCGKHILLK